MAPAFEPHKTFGHIPAKQVAAHPAFYAFAPVPLATEELKMAAVFPVQGKRFSRNSGPMPGGVA